MALKIKMGQMMQDAEMRGVGAGAMGGGRPIGSASFYQATNPEDVKLTVPVMDRGREYLARSPEEAKELRKAEEGYQDVKSKLSQLKQLSTIYARMKPDQREAADSIAAGLAFKLNEINGYNRFTDMDDKKLSKTFSEPGIVTSMFAPNSKTNQLLKDLDNQMEFKRGQLLQGYRQKSSFKKE